jgi:hypothetical protein
MKNRDYAWWVNYAVLAAIPFLLVGLTVWIAAGFVAKIFRGF